jgi:hypothetical protein
MVRWSLLLAVLAAVWLGATPAFAAAPPLVLVYGPGLDRPVRLDDWWGNYSLLIGEEAADSDLADLAERPFLDVALFWGPRWVDSVQRGEPLDQIQPEQANQFGRIYPSFGGRRALIVLDLLSRRLPDQGVALLEQHGIQMQIAVAQPT